MPPSKFKPKKKRDRKAEAIARLRRSWMNDHEDEEWEPEKEPVITPMLKSVGLGRVIDALRMHEDEDARAFLRAWDGCNATDRKYLRVEDIAFASGVSSLRLAEIAQTALFLYAQMQTKMLVSSSMHKVMRSTIKAATDEVPIVADTLAGRIVVGKTNGDVKAMEMFHKMSGMMPLPKGAQIAIQNNFGDKDDAPVLTSGWKTPEERLREIQDMTEPKRLPSPPAEPISIGGRIDHLQAETIEMLRD